MRSTFDLWLHILADAEFSHTAIWFRDGHRQKARSWGRLEVMITD